MSLANLDKLLFPAAGFTKGDLVGYYRAVAPALLPHLADRPTTLVRFPDGVAGPGWFQTNCRGRPDWLAVHVVTGTRGQRLEYGLFDSPAALEWAAGIAAIELHPFLWRTAAPAVADAVVFDLDPGAPAGLAECADVALALRDRLEGRAPLVKTSGRKGLHVYVPASGAGFAATKALARAVAEELAAAAPDRVVAVQARERRAGRVLVDWLQNDPGRSTIAPYSLRALPRPGASVPLAWDEVEEVARTRRAERLAFAPADVLRRLDARGDLWAALATPRP